MKTEIVAGADIGEHGDDFSVVTIGEHDIETGKYKMTNIYDWSKCDTMPTVGKILDIIDKHCAEKINVDATGIGSGVCSRLQELKDERKHKCIVNAFKGGQSPDNDAAKERFLNLKAQACWRLRELFEQSKITIPKHNKLINELNKMKWELTSSKKIKICDPGTKEGDTAEQKSPDYFDSLAMAVWISGTPPLSFGLLNVTPEKNAKPKTGSVRL